MGAANKSNIVFGTDCLEVTRLPVISNTTELIPGIHITGVVPVKINTKPAAPDDANWKYRFNQIVIVDIKLADGTNFMFDVQEIANQAGWTANLAGQQACVAAINAWLATL